MAAPASHRLDLLVLPPSLDQGRAALEPLLRAWEALPGGPVEGGCIALAVEPAPGSAPPPAEPLRFVANRQGGFRVRCPDTGANVVPRFNAAVTAWRDAQARAPDATDHRALRALDCPCGRRHDLVALDYHPPAGFARAWIVLREVADPALRPEAQALAERLLGGAPSVLYRRG